MNSGYAFPGSATNYGSGTNWSNPTNIQVDDSSNATVTLGKDATSAYLGGSNFGFGGLIGYKAVGIEVEINFASVGSDFNSEDVVLGNSGTVISSDKGGSVSAGIKTFGSSTDLWNISYTGNDPMNTIGTSSFGVLYRCTRGGTLLSSASISIDYIKVRIYYKYGQAVNTVSVLNIKTINGI